MTPKEKAQDLYLQMLEWQNHADIYIDRKIISTSAKRCALIAVEEILKQFEKIKVSHIINGYITYKDFEENLTSIQNQLDSEMISKWNYWNEVKQEIQAL